MTDPGPIEEIQTLLMSEFIRERRLGIEKAAELLAQGLYREQLREILAKVARGDQFNPLAEYAQQVLDEDMRLHESLPPRYESKGAEHIVGATCPVCHHPNYYDKRLICPGEERYRILRADGVQIDRIAVKCKNCGKEMRIEVDCEGYK